MFEAPTEVHPAHHRVPAQPLSAPERPTPMRTRSPRTMFARSASGSTGQRFQLPPATLRVTRPCVSFTPNSTNAQQRSRTVAPGRKAQADALTTGDYTKISVDLTAAVTHWRAASK